MARLVKFFIEKESFEAAINKLDREKVYGWTEMLATDANGNACQTASLLNDGRTMVATGGIAQKTVDSQNLEVDKSTLIAKLPDLSNAVLQPSIYDQPVTFSIASIEDLLDLDVTSVYELAFDSEEEKSKLKLKFSKDTVYTFLFNYRTDYEAADAFIIYNGSEFFILTGNKNQFKFLTNEIVEPIVVEENDLSEEELDFGML
jgi:hypothetical protein